MRCEHYDGDFTPKNIRCRFCPAKCRKAAWQRKREEKLAVVEEQLTRALSGIRDPGCRASMSG
jgi:hypothetical protein